VAESDIPVGEALQLWNQGSQDAAIEKLRPLADEGDPAALLAISWCLSNAGRLQEGVPYAKRATEAGDPWVMQWYFAHLADDPATRADAAALVAAHPTGALGTNDPVGRAVEFANAGELERGGEMLRAAAGPHPWTDPPSLTEIETRVAQLDQVLATVNEDKARTLEKIDEAWNEVAERQQALETRSNTLTQLLDTLTDTSTRSYFDQQAKKSATASLILWSFGVSVLVLAACAAFLPVVLNYTSKAHELHGQSSISAHLGATLALAAVAGVLLARARSRDRAGQQSANLSVALGTIYAYSEQIQNQDAKERFKHDMTRLVLENFLEQKASSEDGRRSVLGDIAAAVEPRKATAPE
jgi:hypothetical protein